MRRACWMGVMIAVGGCGGSNEGSARDGGADATEIDAAFADAAAGDAAATRDAGASEIALPPPNAGLDYQLGGPYPPPEGVRIVSRDRNAAPAPALYNVCYLNGFQIQPDEEAFWQNEHPDLILRDGSGQPVIDLEWDEMLIDIRTPEKRQRVAAIVGEWIDGCADRGFDAVEIDNLDTYSRSNGLIAEDHAVAFMRMLSDTAHARGLAIAQKNSAEILGRRDEMDTDFAVVEECNRHMECGEFTAAYGEHVLVIEYRREDFDAGCRGYPELSIVLRDLQLVAPPHPDYLREGC